jgi:methionine sulfoxide reductase heme-binding subunit
MERPAVMAAQKLKADDGRTRSTNDAAHRASRRSLRKDLRSATPDAAASILMSAIIAGILMARVRAGTDYAALEMPEMVRNGGVWAYSSSQALGWVALLWSWLTILLGVSLPLLAQRHRLHLRARVERLHRSTSLTLIALMVGHALVLIWDKMGDTLVSGFVPWATSYVPGRFPQALGIVSFYLAVLLGSSFYLRDRIGVQRWRVLHRYVIPAVYILAVWHTLTYGSDVKNHNGLWFALWGLQFPILTAFLMRLTIRPRR